MKRIVLFSLMLLAVLAVNAQSRRGFISTGTNVNVRTGPGKNYPVRYYEGQKLQSPSVLNVAAWAMSERSMTLRIARNAKAKAI